MMAKARIESVCVLEKCVSVRLAISGASPEATEHLRGVKGKRREFSLSRWRDKNEAADGKDTGEIVFQGTICSINLREDLHLVIHTDKIKALIFEVIEIMDFPAALKFMSRDDEEIATLAAEAAKILMLSEEELIYRESSFTNRYGRQVEGKRSILELSERQKPVIALKLKRFLKEKENGGNGHAGKSAEEAV